MSKDQLWAPWRMEYILRDKTDDPGRESTEGESCFLCRNRDANPADDPRNHVVYRGERAFVVLNRFPYNNGHLLVCPLAHVADPTDLDDETLFETMTLLRRMLTALRTLMSPDGFNVGMNLGAVAGAGLPGHMHWHIVPRFLGDSNFMPVVGNADVIPESLDSLYGRLRELIESND